MRLFARKKERSQELKAQQDEARRSASESKRQGIIDIELSYYIDSAIRSLRNTDKQLFEGVDPEHASPSDNRLVQVPFWMRNSELRTTYYNHIPRESDVEVVVKSDVAYFLQVIERKKLQYPQHTFEVKYFSHDTSLPEKVLVRG